MHPIEYKIGVVYLRRHETQLINSVDIDQPTEPSQIGLADKAQLTKLS